MTAVRRMPAEERKAQILETAAELFAEKGFAGARTKELAQRAGISETLIFRHFKNKEELFAESMLAHLRNHPVLPELEEAMAAEDDFGVFYALALHLLHHGGKDPAMIRLMLYSALEVEKPSDETCRGKHYSPGRSLTDLLAGYIKKRTKKSGFRKRPPDAAARFYLGMVFMYLADQQLCLTGKPPRLPDEAVARQMAEIFVGGLKE